MKFNKSIFFLAAVFSLFALTSSCSSDDNEDTSSFVEAVIDGASFYADGNDLLYFGSKSPDGRETMRFGGIDDNGNAFVFVIADDNGISERVYQIAADTDSEIDGILNLSTEVEEEYDLYLGRVDNTVPQGTIEITKYGDNRVEGNFNVRVYSEDDPTQFIDISQGNFSLYIVLL